VCDRADRRRKSASPHRSCRSGRGGPRASTHWCRYSTCAGCLSARRGFRVVSHPVHNAFHWLFLFACNCRRRMLLLGSDIALLPFSSLFLFPCRTGQSRRLLLRLQAGARRTRCGFNREPSTRRGGRASGAQARNANLRRRHTRHHRACSELPVVKLRRWKHRRGAGDLAKLRHAGAAKLPISHVS
jgi:hypothetical protein